MKRYYSIFVLLVLVGGCTSPPQRYALGGEREVVVFYTRKLQPVLELVDSAINLKISTPQPDSLYHFVPVFPDSYDVYRGYKNVLVITCDECDNYGTFADIVDGRSGLMTARGVFSPDDYIVILSAQNARDLMYSLDGYLEPLDSLLRFRIYELYRRRAFYVGRNEKMEKRVREQYGLDMEIPLGWYILKGTDVQDTILFMGKHNPDRFFFVYKTRYSYPLDIETLFQLRERIASEYYPGDYLLREYVVPDRMYGVDKGLCFYSVWQNDEEVAGGPVKTCAYYDGNYFVMYDIAVFAPRKEDKLQYILRAETIISTLKIVR